MSKGQQNFTNFANYMNVKSVRSQILDKQNSEPYHATMEDATSVLTDMDHFPYTRYYRGDAKTSCPVAFEREAGWRPVHNSCYNVNRVDVPEPYPNHCWESGCSVVYPCYPEYLKKLSDRDALNVQLNKACIVQYR